MPFTLTSRPAPRRARVPWALLCLTLALLGLAWAAQAAEPAATPRFAAPAQMTALRLGPEVLTPQERAFIAGLPEVRVAIPQPAVQPYEMISVEGVVSGIHPEMLGYLARAFGLRVRPVLVPSFADALQALQKHDADLMLTLGYTAERTRYLEYTLGVTPLPGALFGRSGVQPPPAGAGPALERARFAVERDFIVGDYLRRQYPQAQLLTVETTGQALQAVHEGRADYYLGALLTTMDWLSRQPELGLEVARLLNYSSGYYHFAVRKDWAPLAQILNRGISTLRASNQATLGADAALRAALASAPAGMPQAAPLGLGREELQTLVDKPVWRVGAVRGLPLLNHVEPDGQHTGIGAEMTEQVAHRIGIGVQVLPFDNVGEMIDALRRGHIDLIPFFTRTPEREAEFAYSRPYVEMPYVIVARTDAPLYYDLHSLRGKRLALPRLHPLRPLLAQRYAEIQIVDVADGNRAMDAVADGRADAAVEVKLFANLRIQGEGDDRLRTVATVEEIPAQFHFAGLPAARPLLALVDRALQDIPPAENLRMRRRWVAVDLAPVFPWRRHLPVIVVTVLGLLATAAGTAWWIRRLAREVKARRRSEARLRDIGAALPCAAFRHVFEGGQVVASWVSPNTVSLLALQVPAGHTVLASLAERLSAEQQALLLKQLEACLQSGTPLHASVAYGHPDGRTLWLGCEAVRTPAEGTAQALTGVVVDLSGEHDLQARLVQAAQQRNLMLASASHELRAPAHTLALALQALHATDLPAAAQGPLHIARDAVDTLSQLLGDVLDAARLEGAPLRLRARPMDLPAFLHDVAEGAAITARAKGLAFEADFDAGLPARVMQDPLRLKQLLINLLSNAFKYTPAGRVRLHASVQGEGKAEANANAHRQLRLEVADTGPGIDPAMQARLFTPFADDDSASRPRPSEGSSGLGLVICRDLAAQMGGHLELSSEPGHGTRATLLLPLLECAAEPVAAPRAGVVLVCDDDITSRLLLAQLLRHAGYTVEETASGAEVLARCARGGVAAVITDLHMPGMDGAELLRRLRSAAPALGAAPLLVLCSGDLSVPDPATPVKADTVADAAAEAASTRSLADANLAKPVDLQALQQVLRQGGVHPQTSTTQN